MKNLVSFVACILVIVNLALGQSFSFGAAGIYGDDIEEVGIHTRAYYNLKNDRICFGPEFSYFRKSEEVVSGENISTQLKEINLNGHYIIELNEKWGLYPLTGLNVSFEAEKTVIDTGEIQKKRADIFGVNIGIGMHRAVDKWVVFGEFNHLFSDANQNSFLIGAFYTFNKS